MYLIRNIVIIPVTALVPNNVRIQFKPDSVTKHVK